MTHRSIPEAHRPAAADASSSHDDIVVAAFPSSIDLADLYGEEVAAIAAMSFEDRWALAGEMAQAVASLAALRDAR